MDLVKLLDVSSPKGIKETLNKLTEYYSELENDITQRADNANAQSAEAVNIANATTEVANSALSKATSAVETSEEAKQTAESTIAKANQAEADSATALASAQQAVTAANEANTKSTEALEVVNAANQKADNANTQSAQAISKANTADTNANTALTNSNTAIQTSTQAKTKAEQAIEIADQAEGNATEALEFANQAFTAADEANLNSETALSVATDAKQSIIDAIETGTLGSQLFNTAGEFLLSLNVLDDLNTLDETVLQLASAKSIKDYVDTHTPEIDLSSYVKNTDYATEEKGGVVKVNQVYGTRVVNGVLDLMPAQYSEIDSRNSNEYPLYMVNNATRHMIVPANVDYAVKKSLTDNKLVGTTSDWTEEEKESARGLLDAVGSTDYATTTKVGVMKAGAGLTSLANGMIVTQAATEEMIDAKSDNYRVITSKNLDYAVKKALADNKLADTDNAWTAEEQASARDLLGAVPKIDTSGHLRAYGIAGNGAQTVWEIISKADNIEEGRLPRYVKNTTEEILYTNDCVLSSGTPTKNHHVATKEYVDAANLALDTRIKSSIVSVSHDTNTGEFTFTKDNGTTFTVDTLLEKVITNFTYNTETQNLELTLEDGTVKTIPMSAFIDDYVGVDGDIITISISNDNKVSATIKNGTITLDKLTSTLQTQINSISNKIDKVTGKGLSTNDYTTAEKEKLAGLSNYDDSEVRGLIENKANLDASNLSDTNVSSWKEKLGVGESGTKVVFTYYD